MKQLEIYQDCDDSKTVLLAEWQEDDKHLIDGIQFVERVCFLAKPHFSPAALNMNDLQQVIETLMQIISKQDKRITELEKIVYYNYKEEYCE